MGKVVKSFFAKQRGLRITALVARDGQNCTICLKPLDRHIKNPNHDLYITFDRILPASSGGLDELRNFRLAHQICNQKRGNSPIVGDLET